MSVGKASCSYMYVLTEFQAAPQRRHGIWSQSTTQLVILLPRPRPFPPASHAVHLAVLPTNRRRWWQIATPPMSLMLPWWWLLRLGWVPTWWRKPHGYLPTTISLSRPPAMVVWWIRITVHVSCPRRAPVREPSWWARIMHDRIRTDRRGIAWRWLQWRGWAHLGMMHGRLGRRASRRQDLVPTCGRVPVRTAREPTREADADLLLRRGVRAHIVYGAGRCVVVRLAAWIGGAVLLGVLVLGIPGR